MSWIDGLFENRGWLGLMQYNSTTGGATVAGTSVTGLAERTFAAFAAEKVAATLTAGIVYRVTDLHSQGTGSGSLWMYDSGTDTVSCKSGPVLTTWAAKPDPTLYPNLRIRVTDYNVDMVSNGTIYKYPGGITTLASSGVMSTIGICPAATFTSATASTAAAGADTLLTSAGVHGLTSAIAVGASIYISAGTGWTVGYHTITAIAVDTTGTTIQIDTPFASQGTPTISLAGTKLTLETYTIPPLTTTGGLELDTTFAFTSSTNNKVPAITLGTTPFFNPNSASVGVANRILCSLNNRGATNSQVGSAISTNTTHTGLQTSAPTTGTEDTSVATTLSYSFTPAVANERVWIDRRVIKVLS